MHESSNAISWLGIALKAESGLTDTVKLDAMVQLEGSWRLVKEIVSDP